MSVISPQWMLVFGIALSFIVPQQKVQTLAKKWSARLLQLSVIFLGASLNFNSVIKQGASGVFITFISISLIFILGFIGHRFLKIEKNQSLLITMGTAICGGSAIAALAPVIQADALAISISIGVVFILNAVSIFIFPPLGDLFSLSQEQFGTWAALAIHDTSSVVAASSIYGNKALEIATTIKLTRALWIIPIVAIFSLKRRDKTKRISIPWFIFGFILFSILFTFIDFPHSTKSTLTYLAKSGFSMTLFLIGLTFDFAKIKKVGFKPLMFGFILWLIVSTTSLIAIIYA